MTPIDIWRNKLSEIEKQGMPTPIPKSRRFYKNQWHPYGWEVGFRQTVEFPDGNRVRFMFQDIGVNKHAAISNSMRRLGTSFFDHPEVRKLYPNP